MTGGNELSLCGSEMMTCVQHYIDTVLFKPEAAPKVAGVKWDGTSNVFRVQLAPRPPEDVAKSEEAAR